MEQVKLGATGPTVSRLGLGCMGMSGMYGPADRAESMATIAMAAERGITVLDTGDFYGMAAMPESAAAGSRYPEEHMAQLDSERG